MGKYFNWGLLDDGGEEVVKKEHFGIQIFRVTNGNHRSCAAQLSGIFVLETEEDKSVFVSII